MAENNHKDNEPFDGEYAVVHPVVENADDVLKSARPTGVRAETEEERLKRIADMFLARPLYGKVLPDVKKECEEVIIKPTKKEKKKDKEKAGQTQSVVKSGDMSDGFKVYKPIEAFVEPADDSKKSGKPTGCFSFIRAWIENRRSKKLDKKMKKSKAAANRKDLDLSDIIVKIPHSARSSEADDIYRLLDVYGEICMSSEADIYCATLGAQYSA